MIWRRSLLALICTLFGVGTLHAQDLNDELERMTKESVKKVSPSIVQIVTQGGAEEIVTSSKGVGFRKAPGPTTGVIVDADGYIISSAYNFMNQPTTILVTIPGKGAPMLAKRVATDRSRMITLLKVEATGLPTPDSAPKNLIHEGMWAIALGRTLDAKGEGTPSVSVGVISAVGRIWGKALQTDAKISPINYGGPLVDIQGRVQGILIPASPRGEDESAGFEWYDSGIGFAIPFDDVLAVLPRLKQGKDLQKGILGIGMKSQDEYGELPEIGIVNKDSPAARAGLKAGDIVTEIDGKAVVRMAQIKHILGTKYEGDKISLKYKRAGKETAIPELTLVSNTVVIAQPFLGILPMRDDPKLGVEVRHVFPQSSAEKAGIKPGDRIVKFGVKDQPLQPFLGEKPGRAQLLDWLHGITPGTTVALDVNRKDGGKTETLDLVLDILPGSVPGQEGTIPEALPENSTVKQALAPLETPKGQPKNEKEPPVPKLGWELKTTADGDHKYWIYVPRNYNPNVSCSLLVWLHPTGKHKEEDVDTLADMWTDYFKEYNLILVAPLTTNDTGWVPSDADFVLASVREVAERFTIDPQRIVAHGLANGGQMALYLGFNHREVFHGVAAVGAVVTQVKENIINQRLSVYLAGGSLDPLIKGISDSRTKLAEKRYPVVFREIANRGREYLEDAQIRELARWIDMLDRE